MRTPLKLLTVGVVFVTATVAGCSSTAGSSGAVQDDASSAAASSSAASTAPAPSPDPVTPTVAPTEAPASPVASPTDSPPLLGGTVSYCDTGLAYSCGEVGPGGGTVFLAVSQAFSLSNGYTTASCGTDDCHYMEAQLALLPGLPWCEGPGATTSVSPGTGAAIGTGYSNTMTMATFSNYCSSGAANTAKASSSGGYTDWYVPSLDEAGALYNGIGSRINPFTGGNVCWTSSQNNAKTAYWSMVGYGYSGGSAGYSSGNSYKSDARAVCLVRAF